MKTRDENSLNHQNVNLDKTKTQDNDQYIKIYNVTSTNTLHPVGIFDSDEHYKSILINSNEISSTRDQDKIHNQRNQTPDNKKNENKLKTYKDLVKHTVDLYGEFSESWFGKLTNKSMAVVKKVDKSLKFIETYNQNREKGHTKIGSVAGVSAKFTAVLATETVGVCEVAYALAMPIVSPMTTFAVSTSFVGGVNTFLQAPQVGEFANKETARLVDQFLDKYQLQPFLTHTKNYIFKELGITSSIPRIIDKNDIDLTALSNYNPYVYNSISLDTDFSQHYFPEKENRSQEALSYLASSSALFSYYLSYDADALSNHLKIFELANENRFLPKEYAMPQRIFVWGSHIDLLVPPLGRFPYLHDFYSTQIEFIHASLSPIGQARIGESFFNMFSYPKVMEAYHLNPGQVDVNNSKAIQELQKAFIEKTHLTHPYVTGISRLGTAMTVLSSVAITTKILTSHDKKEAIINEIPPFAFGIGGGVLGSMGAPILTSFLCGPSAPGCALGFTIASCIGGSIAGTKLGEYIVGGRKTKENENQKIKKISVQFGVALEKQLTCVAVTNEKTGATIAKCSIENNLMINRNLSYIELDAEDEGEDEVYKENRTTIVDNTHMRALSPYHGDHTDLYLRMQNNQINPVTQQQLDLLNDGVEKLKNNMVDLQLVNQSNMTNARSIINSTHANIETFKDNLALLQKNHHGTNALTPYTSSTKDIMDTLKDLRYIQHNLYSSTSSHCDNLSQFTQSSRPTYYVKNSGEKNYYANNYFDFANVTFEVFRPVINHHYSLFGGYNRDGGKGHCDSRFQDCSSSSSSTNDCRNDTHCKSSSFHR